MEEATSSKWQPKDRECHHTHIRQNTVTRDKDGHCIIIKGATHQEDITVINIYVPDIGAPKYIKQVLTDLKGEIDSVTMIVGAFNTPVTSMNRSSRQKVHKETAALNETLDQMELLDLYKTFHPKAAKYIFFLSAHGTLSRIDHMLGHSLDKFKEIEIISSIFLITMV